MTRIIVVQIFAKTVVILLAMALAGCVKEETKRDAKSYEAVAEKKADPKRALADYIALAEQYMRNGDREGALRSINKGLAIDPDSAEMRNILAFYYDSDGESVLAEKEFKRAISSSSDKTSSYMNYGVFLFKHERYKEACEVFDKAASDVLYRKRDDAFVNLGKCNLKLGNQVAAKDSFNRALMNDPRNASAQIELADIHFNNGNFSESQKLYDEYVKYSRQLPRSLWLGIRLAHIAEDQDKEASYALFLKNQFPLSNEYRQYQEWKASH